MDRLSTTAPTIPDYELINRIGSGAYGEVWLARNLATGARRAVKIVYRATFTDERPFNREFEGIKKFEAISHSHPSQLSLFHVGRNESAGYFYYVMELADNATSMLSRLQPVPGQPKSATETQPAKAGTTYSPHTLRADLENGRLPAPRVLEIALTLTEALSHLHQNGLIHRDVKPSNIIFIQGRPKLADIGLVTDASDSRSIVGTEGYLPAEGPGTPQADLFALGKVLYETLTGHDRRQYPELPADIRAWPDANLAFELNTILLKLCAAHPRDRYPTADALLADLKHLHAGKSIQRRRSFQRRLGFGWKAAALLAISAFAFVFVKIDRQRRAMLADKSKAPWEKAGTTNPAAWQAWERARQMGSTYTTVGLSNAIAEWERATQLDPNYVAAWSTLSVTITIAVAEGQLPGTNFLPSAITYAKKAIELDPRGASYVALGQALISSDYDFAKAEPLFRKEIALTPESWIARNNFAWELLYERNFEEAAQLWKNIMQERPERANPYFGLGIIAYNRGDTTNALSLFDQGIPLAPDRPLWHSIRADFLWQAGQKNPAALAWLRQIELGGFYCLNRAEDSSHLKIILNEEGPDPFLAAFISLLESRRQSGQFVSAFDIARLYAHSGNKSKALDNLEIAIRERRGMNRSVLVNPAFHGLKEEPRFLALLATLRLSPKSRTP